MKILFGEKYYGKDTSEVPSGFLVWLIEEYDKADWTLIDAAKQELAARLKIDWSPKSDHQQDLETALALSTKQVEKLLKERDHLFDVVMMSIQCRGNYYTVEGYLNDPKYMYSIMKMIKDVNSSPQL